MSSKEDLLNLDEYMKTPPLDIQQPPDCSIRSQLERMSDAQIIAIAKEMKNYYVFGPWTMSADGHNWFRDHINGRYHAECWRTDDKRWFASIMGTTRTLVGPTNHDEAKAMTDKYLKLGHGTVVLAGDA